MTTMLTFLESDYQELGARLFDRSTEHMAFGVAGKSEGGGVTNFLVRKCLQPAGDNYEMQSPGGVRLGPEGVSQVLREIGDHPVLVDMHNHVFQKPRFSWTDDQGAESQFRTLQEFLPGMTLVRLVYGPDGSYQGLWTAPGIYPVWRDVDLISVVGPGGLVKYRPWCVSEPREDAREWARGRHLRTLPIVGEKALLDTSATRIGIVGLGGTGSAFLSLARFYFRSLVLIDDDTIEESNLGRLIGAGPADAEAALAKVTMASRELRRVDPGLFVSTVSERFPSATAVDALKGCDVVVACVDNNVARYQLAEFAARHRKVLVEMGSGVTMSASRVAAIGGQVRLMLPGGPGADGPACLACLNLPLDDLEGEETTQQKIRTGYIRGTDSTPGEIVTTNMAVATLAMRNLLALLGGHLPRPVPTYLFYDETQPLILDLSRHYTRREDCPLCGSGEESQAGWGDVLPAGLRLEAPMEAYDATAQHA